MTRSSLALLPLLLVSCASTGGGPSATVAAVPEGFDAQALPAFDAQDGAALDFEQVIERAAQAHVVVLGETHDDAEGHAFQAAIVDALFERFPGSVLALEMLERDEQLLVEDFQDGLIDAQAFARETGSTDWAGSGSWAAWYQPVIDAALENGGRVVAANAPRRYVQLARQRGHAAFDALDEARRVLVDVPFGDQPAEYRDRFFELMGSMGHGHPVPEEMIEAMFGSQSVWDATMAASVHRARPDAERKVALLVGQFHTDFEGGLLGQLRHLDSELQVLSISLQPASARSLREEDRGRADVVVYTK